MPDRTERNDDLEALYRESSAEEPPAALNDAIRQAAHAAVAPAPRGRPRWLAAASLAASLVLAVGVSLTVMLQPDVEQLARPTAAPGDSRQLSEILDTPRAEQALTQEQEPQLLLMREPADAADRGLARNDVAMVESRRGTVKAVVETQGRNRPPRGYTFVPFFDEAVFINKVTLDATCPMSKETDFKKCAVKVTKA